MNLFLYQCQTQTSNKSQNINGNWDVFVKLFIDTFKYHLDIFLFCIFSSLALQWPLLPVPITTCDGTWDTPHASNTYMSQLRRRVECCQFNSVNNFMGKTQAATFHFCNSMRLLSRNFSWQIYRSGRCTANYTFLLAMKQVHNLPWQVTLNVTLNAISWTKLKR